jgi:hypothetical protein
MLVFLIPLHDHNTQVMTLVLILLNITLHSLLLRSNPIHYPIEGTLIALVCLHHLVCSTAAIPELSHLHLRTLLEFLHAPAELEVLLRECVHLRLRVLELLCLLLELLLSRGDLLLAH